MCQSFVIRNAVIEDASFLGKTVTQAIGEELCAGLSGGVDRLPLVLRLFTELAAMPNSQYSYTNAFIALSKSGERVGAVIAYDGADLYRLREAFISKAAELLGWSFEENGKRNIDDETDAGEIYIDSLFVLPEYRCQGIASSLIQTVIHKFKLAHKPIGLLVEPDNSNALKLYLNLGFKEIGINRFFGTPMIHLRFNSPYTVSE